MTSFILKIIALITMTIDHLGYVIFGKLSFMNYIGRIAFPIFAYQISEGYSHTKNLKKYFLRLGIFALISQIPYSLYRSLITTNFSFNIFFTLLLGLCAILVYDKCKSKILGVICYIFIAIFAEVMKVDYGFFGISIIFFFYVFKEKKMFFNISYILLVLTKYLYNILIYNFDTIYLILCVCTLFPLLFINLYNGQQGKKIKYLLYLYYPLHLLLLFLVSKYGII